MTEQEKLERLSQLRATAPLQKQAQDPYGIAGAVGQAAAGPLNAGGLVGAFAPGIAGWAMKKFTGQDLYTDPRVQQRKDAVVAINKPIDKAFAQLPSNKRFQDASRGAIQHVFGGKGDSFLAQLTGTLAGYFASGRNAQWEENVKRRAQQIAIAGGDVQRFLANVQRRAQQATQAVASNDYGRLFRQ